MSAKTQRFTFPGSAEMNLQHGLIYHQARQGHMPCLLIASLAPKIF